MTQDMMTANDPAPAEAIPTKAAGFWIRFGAAFIDFCIFGILSAIIGALSFTESGMISVASDLGLGAGPAEYLIGVINWVLPSTLLTVTYYPIFYMKFGATPGKLAFKLRVIDIKSGSYLGYGQSVLRELFGKWLSILTLGIGYLLIGFRKDKRALHDLIARTQVVRVSR